MNVEAVSHGQTGDDEYAHVFSMLEDIRARTGSRRWTG